MNNPEASICNPQGLHRFSDVAIFQDYHGLPRFLNGVAKFMSKVNGGRVKFEAERIVMSGGATGANEVIMFCLADPGDAFLIPSPYYPADLSPVFFFFFKSILKDMGLGNDQSRRLLSRMAVNDKHGENSAYFDGWKAYDRDPFHPTNNLHGVIQMGLAENQLCFDLIQEWMKNRPEASICNPEGLHYFRDVATFQDYHGLPKFRKGVANFMSKVRGGRVKFDEDRVVMSGGATGANEVIMFCLADPGDAFLIPTPYYPALIKEREEKTSRRRAKEKSGGELTMHLILN
ncbi:hypothetical protein K1719_019211 [Acacia pycnantha]|nr:hypothetical protein K1719_019211 [Acacia pycnantha]